jgi:hypothetical protein
MDLSPVDRRVLDVICKAAEKDDHVRLIHRVIHDRLNSGVHDDAAEFINPTRAQDAVRRLKTRGLIAGNRSGMKPTSRGFELWHQRLSANK